MIKKLTVLLATFLLTFPCASLSEERDVVLVSIEALEVKGEAPPERASAISMELITLIGNAPGIDVVTRDMPATAAAQYMLKGYITAGGERHIVGLQLLDSKTRELVWFDNYDYTSISTEIMAKDVVLAIQAASAKGQRR